MKKLFFLILAIAIFQATQAQKLKLLTYNVRLNVASDGQNAWPVRKPFFLSQLKFYSPDIFGTQEGLPGQVADIAEGLPEYGHIGQGREGGDNGEHVAMFYKKDLFNLLDHHTFWLSDTPDKVSKGWDAAYLRICTYGHFQDKQTKTKFWVFNTHLDNEGANARLQAIRLILRKIDELDTDHEPVFLMGDFNSEPTSDVVKLTKQDFTSADAISQTPLFGPSGTFNNFDFCNPVTLLIDYIFIKNPVKCQVLKYAVLSDSKDCHYPSDHLPVFAEIKF